MADMQEFYRRQLQEAEHRARKASENGDFATWQKAQQDISNYSVLLEKAAKLQ